MEFWQIAEEQNKSIEARDDARAQQFFTLSETGGAVQILELNPDRWSKARGQRFAHL